jgi:uncharacterized protein YcaQ
VAQVRTITPTTARRIAVTRQRLAGHRHSPDGAGILDTVRDIGCLQLDPIGVVARSPLLVLWSRLGAYDPANLDRVLWADRSLFEYWAHRASIVLTEHYPIHRYLMVRYGTGERARHHRLRAWLTANEPLKRHILLRLRREGPLRSRDLEDRADVSWRSSGWTADRNVDQMLDYLWTKGRIMVVGRPGGQKLWDLAVRSLPDWTPRARLSPRSVTRAAAQVSLRALGVATPRHIANHFTIGRYPELAGILQGLERIGSIARVRIADDGIEWPGPWFVHSEDLPLLDRLEAGWFEGRTTLLSPFDNLIIARDRTELLFGIRFRMEIYVPRGKRQFGYYAMPVLHRDRLIGRVDPAMDRGRGVLRVNSVHVEPGEPADPEAGRAVAATIEDLATFLGASRIEVTGPVPAPWRAALAP